METPLLKLRAAALASVLALAGIVPAAAAPAFMPHAPTMQSGVIKVVNSTTIIRRERRHRDGAVDTRRHRRESREHARSHNDGASNFRPRATQKRAYDAYGNYRVYDGDGWEDKGHRRGRDRRRDWQRWDDWNDWDASNDWNDWNGWNDWHHKGGSRLYKLRRPSFQSTVPSPELRDILTAVPD